MAFWPARSRCRPGRCRRRSIDTDDIADVAVAELTDDRHKNKLYEVTGPRALTFADAAAEISQAVRRTIRYRQVSPEEFATSMRPHVPGDIVEPHQKRAAKCQADAPSGCSNPEEITALLEKLPEPLRTACELDAFTGLRRGELIGLQWQDVDFENLVIHVRRSVVMMVAGAPKTEASAKDVPLDAALAESLLKLKLTGPYDRETDWMFVSVTMKGKQRCGPKRYGGDMVAQR